MIDSNTEKHIRFSIVRILKSFFGRVSYGCIEEPGKFIRLVFNPSHSGE